MPCFNHEVAPSYLRTKPEPGVEDKMAQLITRSSQLTPEAIQVDNVLNFLLSISTVFPNLTTVCITFYHLHVILNS